MDPFQGIVIQVISNGQPLELYEDPDAAEIENDCIRQQYVEAVAGSTFSVKVMLTTEFNIHQLRGVDGVNIALKIDGQGIEWASLLSRANIEADLLRGRPGGTTFNNVMEFCPKSGRWIKSDLMFGKLAIKESSRKKLSAEQIAKLGRIQVTLQRVERKKHSIPKAASMLSANAIKEVTEKNLKGRGVAHSVAMTNTRPVTAPAPIEYYHKELPGRAGKLLEYNILYRSKGTLQMLGCIPRSPSPALEISDGETGSPATETEDDSSGDLRGKLQSLRSRLAQLERGGKLKHESRTAVKREREEDETSGHRRRPTKSAKIEVIDLTG